MYKLFNRWLWNKYYIKALDLEEKYNKAGDKEKVSRCIKLQNIMQSLRDELITGKIK